MILVRLTSFPFTLLYATAIVLRNLLYKTGFLTRTDFDFPIVCIGNLAAGGTGKTPHIEWLLQHLPDTYKKAVLSRGYMRKTTGYVLADTNSTAAEIGDEPLQLKQKFPDAAVAVCENRVLGVPHLLADEPDTSIILMDDGFQHLAIKAGLNVLLTSYENPFYNDWLLPSGRLREFRNGYKRAQIIIITKCPEDLTKQEQQEIINQINPLQNQQVLFTGIRYAKELKPVFMGNNFNISDAKNISALAFSGIANPTSFKKYLETTFHLQHFSRYSDHHNYTQKELQDITTRFDLIASTNKIIITTEKDAKRLQTHAHKEIISSFPVFYQPIEVYFLNGDGANIISHIANYIEQER